MTLSASWQPSAEKLRKRSWPTRFTRVICPLCDEGSVVALTAGGIKRYTVFKCNHALRQRLRLPGYRGCRALSFYTAWHTLLLITFWENMGMAIPMIMYCPQCAIRHIDTGVFANKPHHTHACQHCGNVWRPAIVPTVGVQFLPGFQDILQSKTEPPVPQNVWTGVPGFYVLWVEGQLSGVLQPLTETVATMYGLTQAASGESSLWTFTHATGLINLSTQLFTPNQHLEAQAWALSRITEAPPCSR